MEQTINIDLKYNSEAQNASNFSSLFKHDFEYCMERFKMQVKFNEKGISTGNFSYQFVIVTNSDLQSSNYSNSLKSSINSSGITFLIILDPIKEKNTLLLQQKYISFNFWDQIVETGEIRLIKRDDRETQSLYWERIADIVFEITDRIVRDADKGQVYLAQTDDSQAQDRDSIKRDLHDLGYNVIPNTLLNRNLEESSGQVNELLNKSNLIIHLIPAIYTEYFDSKSISVVEHQCNLSAQYIQANHPNVKRIIWIPSDYDVVDEKNQIFIEKIQRDHDLSHNTLVLKVNLEDLKKIYRKILSGEEVVKTDQKTLPDLYVIADKDDSALASNINEEAMAAGLKVGTNFNGISYNEHLRYLASAQVVVVNYTLENQQWINVKIHDILKSPGLEISKPNKKLVLIKKSKELETAHFEKYFNEVHVVEANDIKLNLQ
ncbi:MAG: hypothetical protein AB7S48_05005 [Bacteroidales bacterium]